MRPFLLFGLLILLSCQAQREFQPSQPSTPLHQLPALTPAPLLLQERYTAPSPEKMVSNETNQTYMRRSTVRFYFTTPVGGRTVTLPEGEQRTVVMGGVPYEIRVVFIAPSRFDEVERVKLAINKQYTRSLAENEDQYFEDFMVYIRDIDVVN